MNSGCVFQRNQMYEEETRVNMKHCPTSHIGSKYIFFFSASFFLSLPYFFFSLLNEMDQFFQSLQRGSADSGVTVYVQRLTAAHQIQKNSITRTL